MINGGYGRKMVVKELFGKVKIYRLHTRVDNRGSLAYIVQVMLILLLALVAKRKLMS